LSSFKGISPGAKHYYASLDFTDKFGNFKSREVLITLTEKSAERYSEHDYKFLKGDTTARIESRNEAIKCSLKEFKKIQEEIGKNSVLILGKGVYVEPQPIIGGKKGKIVNQINKFAKQAEKLTWEHDEKKLQPIWDKWHKIFKKNFK
jgi:hypothetical protein